MFNIEKGTKTAMVTGTKRTLMSSMADLQLHKLIKYQRGNNNKDHHFWILNVDLL